MSHISHIEWTDSSWNPLTGCSKVSAGCANCYAERLAKRLQSMGNRNYANGFRLTLHEASLDLPLRWSKPRMVFVNSMSDLFHEDVPEDFILSVFATMNAAAHHTFQILTKRSARLAELSKRLPWARNIWMGVSVEQKDYERRIEDLQCCDARVRFISLEPLLGPLPRLNLEGINWLIVGGESGPGARPMKKDWVLDIRDQCQTSNVPFFFKQWGGISRSRAGRLLEGRTWDQMPEVAPHSAPPPPRPTRS